MYSVTQRIDNTKQPKGGYLPTKMFEKIKLEDSKVLYEEENVHASTVGLCVDYLTRFLMGATVKKAFAVSFCGAKVINKEYMAMSLASQITGLDDLSIVSACKLVGFDVCCRNSMRAYKPVEEINPNDETIHNIRTMVERSCCFFEQYGPVKFDGIDFVGGYTSVISSGDGDFLTEDTLWDFKVSKRNITNKHTLQVLIYYIMGLHSIHREIYENVKKLGFFNPRLNIVYLCPVESIDSNVISDVECNVIGYGKEYGRKESFDDEFYYQKTSTTLSVKEASQILRISQNKVRQLIREGQLRATKIKNKYEIRRSDLELYLQKRRMINIVAWISMILVLLLLAIIFGNIFQDLNIF